jgi:hypothetical protein
MESISNFYPSVLSLKQHEQSVIIRVAGLRVEIPIQNFPNNEAGVTTVTRSSVGRLDIGPRWSEYFSLIILTKLKI